MMCYTLPTSSELQAALDLRYTALWKPTSVIFILFTCAREVKYLRGFFVPYIQTVSCKIRFISLKDELTIWHRNNQKSKKRGITLEGSTYTF